MRRQFQVKGYTTTVVGELISQQSQISTVQRLKFLLRAKLFKLNLLLMPLLQNRLTQAMVFCGRATLKGQRAACGLRAAVCQPWV